MKPTARKRASPSAGDGKDSKHEAVGAAGKSGRNRRFQLQDPVLRPVELLECSRSLCCVGFTLARLWSGTERKICEEEPAKVDVYIQWAGRV